MKKILFILIAVFFSTGLFAQNTDGTGTGWTQTRRKEHFKDSTYFDVAPTYAAGQTIDVPTIAPLLTDTIPGFTFGRGTGAAADTTNIANGEEIGAWKNVGSDTACIYIIDGGVTTSKNAPSIYVNVYWNDSLWVSGAFKSDSLLTTALNINSLYGLSSTTTFRSYKVPPNNWCWVEIARTPILGTKPAAIRGSVGIYKLRGHGRD